jgi:putative ABC transport system substrate-binding protein
MDRVHRGRLLGKHATVMTTCGERAAAAMVCRLSLVVFLSLLTVPLAADAQSTANVHRIGYLGAGTRTANTGVDAFREELRGLGWVEGNNIVIDYRFADGRHDRLPELAAELVRLKVELIVAVPTPAALAAKNATATIPIVISSVGDPVSVGLVASLARPGGNITGVSFDVGLEMFGKELQLLKEAVPNARKIAILSNPANPAQALAVNIVNEAARSLGVSLLLLEARTPNEFESAFKAMAKDRVEALLVVQDSMFMLHRVQLADLAAKYKLPSMHGFREHVEAGTLMSYGPNLSYQFRQAAAYVDKILKGARPADLAVEQPTKFELVVNLKIAKALGLTIPQSLLVRADEVIR